MKETSINNNHHSKKISIQKQVKASRKKISSSNKSKRQEKKNSNYKSKSSQSKDSILDTIITIINISIMDTNTRISRNLMEGSPKTYWKTWDIYY